MPVTVYALRFESGEIYVGMSSDISRRFEEHARRKSPSTRQFAGAFTLIYTREFASFQEARSHEKYLKSGHGRTFLKSNVLTPQTHAPG